MANKVEKRGSNKRYYALKKGISTSRTGYRRNGHNRTEKCPTVNADLGNTIALLLVQLATKHGVRTLKGKPVTKWTPAESCTTGGGFNVLRPYVNTHSLNAEFNKYTHTPV
jgi:hypothetical protein